MIRAEVIAIGDELTTGQRLDTNSQWLSQQLGDIGIRVAFHTTVGDQLEENIDVFRTASLRSDLVVVTGGLGPTADDLTREALADAFDAPLELDEASLRHIESLFRSRARSMPERNRVQALFPRGGSPIRNPHGSAPGIDLTVPRSLGSTRFFCLPGVPAEMKQMWTETVRPVLLDFLGDEAQITLHHQLKCFGVGESALEEMLPDLIRRGRDPLVGITVSQATITLRISATAPSVAACQEKIAPTVTAVRQAIGSLVFGEGDDELQDVVVRKLVELRATLATCEWGTGGLVAQWLHDARQEGAKTFAGGLVLNDAEDAERLLQVSPTLAPDKQVADFASAGRTKFQADYCLASGAALDTNDERAWMFLALATPSTTMTLKHRFAGHPEILIPRAAKQLLDMLRLHLEEK